MGMEMGRWCRESVVMGRVAGGWLFGRKKREEKGRERGREKGRKEKKKEGNLNNKRKFRRISLFGDETI